MLALSRHVVLFLMLLLLTFSCSQGPSLQTYYVDNQEKPGFLSVDIPSSFLKIDKATLSSEQLEAYQSINKLNMLGYKVDANNIAVYNSELTKVKTILDDDQYEELIRGGNTQDGKFVVKYTGDIENIDEFIIFGNAADKGFAIIRVLGKDMNANKIMTLSQVFDNSNVDDDSVKQFMEFFE